MHKVIDVKNLQKTYNANGKNPTTALSGINFVVNEGDFVAIMGRSGSGKSSLMHVIGLLDQHFEGDYLLNGVSVRELSQSKLSDLRSLEIGFVFQQFNLLKRRTVLQNVLLPTVLLASFTGMPSTSACRCWKSGLRWKRLRPETR